VLNTELLHNLAEAVTTMYYMLDPPLELGRSPLLPDMTHPLLARRVLLKPSRYVIIYPVIYLSMLSYIPLYISVCYHIFLYSHMSSFPHVFFYNFYRLHTLLYSTLSTLSTHFVYFYLLFYY